MLYNKLTSGSSYGYSEMSVLCSSANVIRTTCPTQLFLSARTLYLCKQNMFPFVHIL